MPQEHAHTHTNRPTKNEKHLKKTTNLNFQSSSCHQQQQQQQQFIEINSTYVFHVVKPSFPFLRVVPHLLY